MHPYTGICYNKNPVNSYSSGGIAGIVELKHPPADGTLIQKMTDKMAHRGPDAGSFFLENEIALGHRRLSIIDLSTAANQPFTDHSGRYVMVFNGELYN